MQIQKSDKSLSLFIVAVSLFQGCALFCMQMAEIGRWWPLPEVGSRICGYTVMLAAPTVMMLTVQRLRDPRFWQQAFGVTALFSALSAWQAWNMTGVPGMQTEVVLVPFGLLNAFGLFLLLPYLQCRLTNGRWTAPYPELFNHSWDNGLTLLLIIPLMVTCWAVLLISGAVLTAAHLEQFSRLLKLPAFVYLASAVMVGLAILILRTYSWPLKAVRRLVFHVFRILLPVLCCAIGVLLIALPLAGLDWLWRTQHAALLLMLLVVILVLLVNSVFQDGEFQRASGPRYSGVIGRVVKAGIVLLPVYGLLAAYAVWLRVDQYGWTPPRFYAALTALMLMLYALAYALSTASFSAGWLSSLRPINVSLSWLIMGLILMLNSPILDPFRISIASQLGRLHDGDLRPDELDLEFFRLRSGRKGYAALNELQSDPDILRDTATVVRIGRMLEPHPAGPDGNESPPVRTLDQARQRIRPVPGSGVDDEGWLTAMLAHQIESMNCFNADQDCIELSPDLDADGKTERLLCSVVSASTAQCQVSTRRGDQWIDVGSPVWLGGDAVIEALRQGQFAVQPSPWMDLVVGGATFSISPH